MTKTEMDAIYEKALKAKKGKWACHETGMVSTMRDIQGVLHSHNHTPYIDVKNAEFICAANPQAVIALIDKLRVAEEAISHAIGPTREVKTPMLREALSKIRGEKP